MRGPVRIFSEFFQVFTFYLRLDWKGYHVIELYSQIELIKQKYMDFRASWSLKSVQMYNSDENPTVCLICYNVSNVTVEFKFKIKKYTKAYLIGPKVQRSILSLWL